MFDFLKKKKKEKELGSLTMPELPKLPEFPSLPEEKTLQKKSKSIKPKKMSHEIQIPNIKISAPKKPIEIQPEKNKGRIKNIITKPLNVLSKSKKYEQEIISEEIKEFHEKRSKKESYVEGNMFKQIITDITIINNELKENYDSLSKIIDIEKTKELKFKKFKSSLLSMQRKFILTDKILFRSR